MKKILTGFLRHIPPYSWYFDEGTTDNWPSVKFDGEHDTPINEKIKLTVYEDPNGGLRVNPIREYYVIL